MNKTIISIALIVSLALGLAAPAVVQGEEAVEQSSSKLEIKLDKEAFDITEYITGTGELRANNEGVRNAEVTLLVEDYETELSIYTIGQYSTNANGEFNIKFKMPTSISEGKYRIRLKSGAASASHALTITRGEAPAVELSSIEIQSSKTQVRKGSSLQLELTGTMSDGSAAAEADLSEVKWSSSDSSTAAVDQDGLVKGESTGTAVITAKIEDLEDSIEIKVTRRSSGGSNDRNDSRDDDKDKDDEEEENKEKAETEANKESIEFKDVGSDLKWAEEAIKELAKRNIIEGVGNNNFKPKDNITRAAFAKIIVEAFKLEGTGASAFSDVAESDWYSEYVNIAASKGIIVGHNNDFRPNDEITREEMAVIIARALNIVLPGQYTKTSLDFEDADLVSDWAKEALSIVSSNGIINGVGNGRFAPKELATRAEAAVIVYRLLELAEML